MEFERKLNIVGPGRNTHAPRRCLAACAFMLVAIGAPASPEAGALEAG